MAIKKYNEEELLIARSSWKTVCVSALSTEQARIFNKRKKAVDLYIDGYPLMKITELTGILESKIAVLVSKCMSYDSDGVEYGYTALIPFKRIKSYTRNAFISTTDNYSGSFTQLLLKYPQLTDFIDKTYFNKNKDVLEKSINKKNMHERFLEKCRELGIQDYEYPFNTISKAERTIYSYLDTRKDKFPGKAIFRESKDAIQKYYSTGIGRSQRPVPLMPFSVIQIDGHKIDMLYTVEVLNSHGEILLMPATRMWLIAVIDVATKVILGYSLSQQENYNQTDVLKALRNSMIPHKELTFTIGGFKYPENGGYASNALPDTKWALVNTIMLDNTKAHLAENVIYKLTQELGCSLNFGPVATPITRAIVERVFGTLEENSFHRMPSTTGSNSSDPRRINAESNAVKYAITYDDIAQLTEYTIADYNNSINLSLDNQTPLKCMERRIAAGMRPNIATNKIKEVIKSLTYMHETRKICGDIKTGKRPYISYKGAYYRNNILSNSSYLIGQTIHLLINPDDISSIFAYNEAGEELGTLTAVGEYGTKPHSLKTREWANKVVAKNKREGKKIYTPLAQLEKELEERAKSQRRARTKHSIMKKEQEHSKNPITNERVNDSNEDENLTVATPIIENEIKPDQRMNSFTDEEMKALLEANSIEEAIRKGLL